MVAVNFQFKVFIV